MRNLSSGGTIFAIGAILAGGVWGFPQAQQQAAARRATNPVAGYVPCGSAAFLTFEQGKLAAVDWVDRSASQVHSRVIETQSHVVDVTIQLRSDETAARSSVTLSTVGEE